MTEDIEDLLAPDVGLERKPKESITRKSNKKQSLDITAKTLIWVKTWGCGHNNSDGEYMAGLLSSHGYTVILEDSLKHKAHLWLLNSCTVKGPSEQTFINEIKAGKQDGKHIVVAGCVPQGSKDGIWSECSTIGVHQIDQVVQVVHDTLDGCIVSFTKDKRIVDGGKKRKAGGSSLDLPKLRRNPWIEIIPINTGCLNNCTYCKTKHARGDLGSYDPSEIYARVETVIHQGVKEIWLTSEDLGAYGRDIGVAIPDLLWGIINIIESHDKTGTVMLRVGMTNPPYILEHVDEMCKILNHPRVYKFLHVPIQSASNKVLDDMRRLYTLQDYKKLVSTLIKNCPGITIATDVICGFPTEDDEDFEQTLNLVSEFRFPILHISQFYPRPGTPAARNSVKDIGEIFEILITERASDGVSFVGHDSRYRQVIVPQLDEYMGKKVTVKVVDYGKYYLKAEYIDELKEFPSLFSQKNPIPQFRNKRGKLVKSGTESLKVSGTAWDVLNSRSAEMQYKALGVAALVAGFFIYAQISSAFGAWNDLGPIFKVLVGFGCILGSYEFSRSYISAPEAVKSLYNAFIVYAVAIALAELYWDWFNWQSYFGKFSVIVGFGIIVLEIYPALEAWWKELRSKKNKRDNRAKSD